MFQLFWIFTLFYFFFSTQILLRARVFKDRLKMCKEEPTLYFGNEREGKRRQRKEKEEKPEEEREERKKEMKKMFAKRSEELSR